MTAASVAAASVTKALGGRNGMARCPAHDDHTPSLSVSEASDGKLLVHCHAGCDQETVWAALKDRGLVGNGPAPASAMSTPGRHHHPEGIDAGAAARIA